MIITVIIVIFMEGFDGRGGGLPITGAGVLENWSSGVLVKYRPECIDRVLDHRLTERSDSTNPQSAI